MESESNVITFIPKEIKEVADNPGLSNGVTINWFSTNTDTEDIYKKYKEFYDKNIRTPSTPNEVTADELIKFVLSNPSLANFFGLYIDPTTFDMECEIATESLEEEPHMADIIDARDPEMWKKKDKE